MSKIRVLATEDDPLHVKMLRLTLDKLGYSLVDIVSDPSEFMRKIAATKPDILLMDIDLGNDISGIELSKKINALYNIPIIYVTAFTDSETFQDAIKTFPSGYIVKPYKSEDLQRAMELAISNQRRKKIPANTWAEDILRNRNIYVKEKGRLKKVELSSIDLIEAYDKYCYVYTANQKIMIRSRLTDVIEQLPSSVFCQVHRSFVVNVNSIDSISASDHSISIAGKIVTISKTYYDNFFSRVKTIG